MDAKIIGDDMQAVIFSLQQGERILSEAGAMMYMKGSIAINAELKGGILGGIKRALTRESLFLITFDATANGAELGLASPIPGHIQGIKLNKTSIICERDAFLAASGEIETDVTFTKRLGFGFFGGEGFILQKITGTGEVFINAGGNFVEMKLTAGETVDVDTGCIVAMDDTVDYDIKSVGNIKTSIFAGEGLFVAHLTGPGKVLIQTLPFSRMAEKIAGAVSTTQGESRGVAGIGGNILKSIMSGS
jgi:uncharacterized protein (TIGR00266 family)